MRLRTNIAILGAVVAIAVVAGVRLAARDGASTNVERDSTTTAVSTTSTTAPVGRPGAAGVGDPYFPTLGNGGYDVDHYTLTLTWTPSDGSISGQTRVEATATQNLSRFNLDLAGLEVTGVLVNDLTTAFNRVERELEITPAHVIPRGARFSAVVAYHGVPQPVSDGTDLIDVGWRTNGRGAFVVSEPTGAETFFPVNDHPSDKATYVLEITAPADQSVAASGLLVDVRDRGDGTKTWTYDARDPMASYLLQIAIGDFVLIDGGNVGAVTIRHAVHRPLVRAVEAVTARTADMIDVLDDIYGPFPFESYGVLVVDAPLGFALETQTLTIVGSDIAHAGGDADLILLHELSHQWVGDAVSPSTWKDIWLSEGLATYSEWLWTERTGGRSAATSARNAAHSKADLAQPPGDPGSGELFTRSVYLRGGMTLQALRETIGDPAFFTVLRTWVDDHRGGSASTADFIALAERISGQQLDNLFLAWLYANTNQRL